MNKVICIKLGKEVVPYSDRIMNILIEVFKNKQAVAQVCCVFDFCVDFVVRVVKKIGVCF